MNLGDTLKKLRAEQGLKPGELAKLTGVSRGYLWQLESGNKEHPSFEILQRIAQGLGVPVSAFSESPPVPRKDEVPSGLAAFLETRGKALGVQRSDIEVMKNVHFRGRQPKRPEDWELLFLFLRKWVR